VARFPPGVASRATKTTIDPAGIADTAPPLPRTPSNYRGGRAPSLLTWPLGRNRLAAPIVSTTSATITPMIARLLTISIAPNRLGDRLSLCSNPATGRSFDWALPALIVPPSDWLWAGVRRPGLSGVDACALLDWATPKVVPTTSRAAARIASVRRIS
jgi:hypothetical protein